ncbi:MAG: S8 family serine peptidase [Hyphomicrobiales bacterium]|nr:S8 family serine peptidase [Hyphomicrobiales bacterium]
MTYEYKVLGQTVRLEPDPNLIAVRFHPTTPRGLRADIINGSGLRPFSDRFDIPNEGITLVSTTGALTTPVPNAAINTLSARAEVAHATPVFQVGDNKVVPSDRIIVRVNNRSDIQPIIDQFKLYLVRERESEFLLQVPSGADPLKISNEIADLPGVAYSEPDFITIGQHLPKFIQPSAISPLGFEPLAPRQYAVTITHALEAWTIANGSRNIRIAILDEGVDLTHPDLAPAVVGSFDGVDGDTYQQPNSWDGHGTSCAGLALGAAPNVASGVRGIGAGCSLLAVRIAYSRGPGSGWITTNETIARCIDWSWNSGASVLSNSWGDGAPSNAIVFAFERARTQGRGGLGCVIAIAAGNASGPVNFPATIPNVLAVSASNEFDEFKNRMSSDGETFWGSCFGPQISVAAPGVHNFTTDIVAVGGYDPGNYFAMFNGTSSATPLVAGACGLILSVAPNLREEQVRTVLTSNADKVGAAPYVAGRNDFFGFGRLNVLRAIQSAQAVV